MSIRVIFWDIGGVVLTNGWDTDQRARVLGRLGINVDAYEEVHSRANYYWERGLMSAREFFAQTVLHPNPGISLSFESLWPQVCAESKVLHPECMDLLAELKLLPMLRLATLNNESRELNDARLDMFKLRNLFDFFICSGYVHEMKPLPGIYRSAVEISGFDAQSTLFIDDKRENCEAARAIGMHAIRFIDPPQLRAALIAYGVGLTG